MKNQYLRQSSIIDIESFRDNEITIIGCGAIGSYVAVSLAKMGLTKFTLYDMDKVELHNLPNQFFGREEIGEYKTISTEINMYGFNNEVKVNCKKKYKGAKLKTQIVISCVDNMDVRNLIFEACKKDKKVQLFIDTRMGGLQGQVYTIDMNKKKEIANYEKSLFPEKEKVPIRCTERSIIFTVLGISSLVCSQIINVLNGKKFKNYLVIDYSLPQLF